MIYTAILRHMIEDDHLDREPMLLMLNAIDIEHQKALNRIEELEKGDKE